MPEQDLILNYTGSAVISAGPGAGKTTLYGRKADLLLEQDLNIPDIQPLTFSRSGVKAMKDKAKGLANARTFHSFAREHSYIQGKSVINTYRTEWDERTEMLCEVNGYSHLDYEKDPILQDYIRHIFREIDKRKSRPDYKDFPSEYESSFKLYQKFLEETDQVDYNDMLVSCIQYLKDHETYFKWILVDEGHDTSMIQYEVLKLIKSDYVWWIYSPHQMIYRWNDADERNITKFRQDYKPKEFSLKNNYRSGPQIVNLQERIYTEGMIPIDYQGRKLTKNTGKITYLAFPSFQYILDIYLENPTTTKILARTNKELEFYREKGAKCSTLHKSKGTEIESIIFLNCQEGKIPFYRSSDLEEEKNLLYVGLSRAKNNLYICYDGNISPFLAGKEY